MKKKKKKLLFFHHFSRSAHEFRPNDPDILYGLSLCSYKLMEFDEAYEHVQKIFQLTEEQEKKHLYLKAICSKQLGKLQEAESDYQVFYKQTSPKDFVLLMHFMFLFAFKKIK